MSGKRVFWENVERVNRRNRFFIYFCWSRMFELPFTLQAVLPPRQWRARANILPRKCVMRLMFLFIFSGRYPDSWMPHHIHLSSMLNKLREVLRGAYTHQSKYHFIVWRGIEFFEQNWKHFKNRFNWLCQEQAKTMHAYPSIQKLTQIRRFSRAQSAFSCSLWAFDQWCFADNICTQNPQNPQNPVTLQGIRNNK